MTGLEKIISKINEKSAKRSEDIIGMADQSSASILSQADNDIKAIETETEARIKLRVEEMLKMAESGAQQKAKQIILSGRIEAINEALAASAEALKSLSLTDYFALITALVVKNASPGQGIILFSVEDLKRLPTNFEMDLNDAIKGKQAVVKISSEPAGISDGFILVYGDIEINCTFDALIEASREELKELINGILF